MRVVRISRSSAPAVQIRFSFASESQLVGCLCGIVGDEPERAGADLLDANPRVFLDCPRGRASCFIVIRLLV